MQYAVSSDVEARSPYLTVLLVEVGEGFLHAGDEDRVSSEAVASSW